MEDLPARLRKPRAAARLRPQLQVMTLEISVVAHLISRRRTRERRRDVIRRAVALVVRSAKLDDPAKQFWLAPRGDAHCFQVTRAGRLHVEQAARLARERGIDRELVRSRVQAELVRPERAGELRVIGQRALELGDISLVIDALLEVADESRREA